MALTKFTYPPNAVQTLYSVNFGLGYLSQSHVKVHTGDPNVQLGYTWVNSTQIQLTIPHVGSDFYIQRIVPRSALQVDYNLGAIITDTNLDQANLQHLMITEELTDELMVTVNADVSASAAAASASAASTSASNAAAYAGTATAQANLSLSYATASGISEDQAAISAALALGYSDAADADRIAALAHASAAQVAENNAETAETNAELAKTNAETAATNSANSASAANTSATNAATFAANADTAADTALAAANFKGDWSLLGAIPLNKPSSVRHDDKVWILLNNLLNIATSEPGVSADWFEYVTSANVIRVPPLKAGVLTTVNNSTTRVVEPLLTISTNRGGYWKYRAVLLFSTSTDVKVGLGTTAPTYHSILGTASVTSDDLVAPNVELGRRQTINTAGVRATSLLGFKSGFYPMVVELDAIIKSIDAVYDIEVWFAQATAHASVTQILYGSYVEIEWLGDI